MILQKLKLPTLTILAGALYALGFPLFNEFSLFFAPIIGFALFNWALDQNETLKGKMLIGFCYSLGFYLLGFYWIPHVLKEFGMIPAPLNYLLGLFFSVLIIPQVYFYSIAKKYTSNIYLLALVYILLERFIPQQFPAHLGHSFLSLTPTIKLTLAPIGGAIFYSFFSALIALAALKSFKDRKIVKLPFVFALATLVAHIPFETEQLETSKKLNVRIVQPNIGNFMKLDSEKGGISSMRDVFSRYEELSTKNLPKENDLIIWPETAFPTLMPSKLLKNESTFAIPNLLERVITQTGSQLFIGGYDSNEDFNSYKSDYNAAFFFGRNAKLNDVYHKMKLIPFGEGLPFGPFNDYLSQWITNISYFSEGEKFTQFKTDNDIPFNSAICYEILFSSFIADMLNDSKTQPDFLINLTNDSWYGDTAEPYQHLFLSKWRALEFNLPIIRSTNTGITSIIYPNGAESKRMGVGMYDYLDVHLDIMPRDKTIFQKIGIFFTIVLSLGLFLIDLAIKRKTFFK